jgi:hypothetical protein
MDLLTSASRRVVIEMTVDSRTRQCEQQTKAGARCRSNAVSGSTMCFVHDPALERKRTEARRHGGARRRRAVLGLDSPEISLRSGPDSLDLARRLLESLLRGEVDPKVINSAVGLLNFWQRAHSTEVLERRIIALEAAQNTGPQRSPDRIEGAEHFGARGEKS